LDDDEDSITGTEGIDVTVLARPDSGETFEETNEQTKDYKRY
jgi:hypothetical protein